MKGRARTLELGNSLDIPFPTNHRRFSKRVDSLAKVRLKHVRGIEGRCR